RKPRRRRKDRERIFSRRRGAATDSFSRPEPSRQRRPDAVRQKYDDREQHDPVNHLFDARRLPAERRDDFARAFRQRREQRGADDGAEKRADAADDRTQNDFHRAVDAEDLLGKKIAVVKRRENSGDSGQGGAQGHGENFPAKGIDAESARGVFVFADRLPVIAGAALQEPRAQRQRRGGEQQNDVVIHRRRPAQVGEVVLPAFGVFQKQTAGAAEPGEMIQTDAGKFRAGDREQREVDPGDAVAKGQRAERRAEKSAERGGQPQPRPGADAEVKVKSGGGVGAGAEIEGVAERKLPGKTHHDVPRLAGEGEVKKQRRHR